MSILPKTVFLVATHNLSGTLDGLTLLDQTIGTEKHNTDLSSFQVHAHSLDTRCEPVDLSIAVVVVVLGDENLLDKLLSLDIAHTVNTGDTITIIPVSRYPITSFLIFKCMFVEVIETREVLLDWLMNIPDGQDTSSLSETRLLLNTSNSLLEDGGNLSR